jgi:hypothetical protein
VINIAKIGVKIAGRLQEETLQVEGDVEGVYPWDFFPLRLHSIAPY